jgi:MAF protein
MKKIYLASDSKARRKLLSIFGLKFTVLPSRIAEKTPSARRSFEATVKANALAKAEAVAAKVKCGAVIGADTIVVMGKKVYGKPRDMEHARRMLKSLSGKPQWIYTGLALVDTESGRRLVECEKTKIYMDKLSGREIDAYFSSVSPLDKAGSFDIQGKGAFFIRRIEGCFYSVVGLPVRRLYRMFLKMGIRVFLLACVLIIPCLALSGCVTREYNIVTGKEEMYFYSDEKEVAMGKSIAQEVEKKIKLVDDPLLQKRVQDIGAKIAAVCDRKDIAYTFKVIDDKEVNAVSLPGGFVYVNKGLIDRITSDDELAGVLGHEVGHITARHSIKKLQSVWGYTLVRLASIFAAGNAGVQNASDLAFTELSLGYSRQDELLADQLAARYAARAGYNPKAMLSFLNKLEQIERLKPISPPVYWKTHPNTPDRIRVVKQEMGEPMNFKDFINIEEQQR